MPCALGEDLGGQGVSAVCPGAPGAPEAGARAWGSSSFISFFLFLNFETLFMDINLEETFPHYYYD